MSHLILSILFSSLLFVIFRWMGLRSLKTFPVIVINYLVAGILGTSFILYSDHSLWNIFQSDWLWSALLLGFAFVFIFNIMAVTTQKYGTSVAVVANKMSLVIPVVFAFIAFNDSLTIVKISGIILALIGVYLTMKKKDVRLSEMLFQMPVLLFILSGLTDLSIKQIQHHYLNEKELLLFVPVLFFSAFIAGMVKIVLTKKDFKMLVHSSHLTTGIVLGILNYFSIYFIFSALASPGMESSVVFPLNNISIVLLASLFGLVLFKEKLQSWNYVGIAFAIVSIFLIGISS